MKVLSELQVPHPSTKLEQIASHIMDYVIIRGCQLLPNLVTILIFTFFPKSFEFLEIEIKKLLLCRYQ